MSLHQHYLYDIALSYAGEDRDHAEALANELRSRGVKVFYDNYEKSDMVGKNLYTHLSDVYSNKALYCVMFLSQHYANKQWTKHEREAAQARAFGADEEYILPVRLDQTEIPGISPTIAYLSWPPETAETIAEIIIAKMYEPYKDLFISASQSLFDRRISEALCLLEPLHLSQVPSLQRWRLAALRGQCYFEQRRFVKAQGDFVYATQEMPKQEGLPLEQKQELLLLHLHLAATYRELYQLNDALEQFQIALSMMSRDTPYGLVAEAHWGMSLIALTQAMKMQPNAWNENSEREEKLYVALEHAEHARLLYHSIGEKLHAASITCNIAEIEQALGRKENTSRGLLDIVNTWKFVLDMPETTQPDGTHQQKQQANVVATVARLLSNMELAEQNYEQALEYANLALQAGNRSYILRKADAYVLLARIFEEINDVQAEQAYREALKVLECTDRIGIRISTHVRLGSYLLKIGQIEEGQQELEQARTLSELVLYER